MNLSIRRPVAVAMFFLGIVMMGAVAWQRMPVELFPALAGDRLFVTFSRPGSEPQVVEREILLPLQARVAALPGVSESWAEIRGSSGRYQVRFEPGADLKVRELELQRIAAALQRAQPRGTRVVVSSFDTSLLASFAMMVHVLGPGGEDRNALHDLVEERVAPRFASVSGVSQATTGGGAGRQVTVAVDPDRVAALGVTTEAVTESVNRNVGHLRYLGQLESGAGRMPVLLDGRPPGLHSLGEVRVDPERPVLLRHVSDLGYGSGREEVRFRVNGQPAVGVIVFQEEGANLVRLGRRLRARTAELQEELRPLGLDLVVGFDAAELVEDQIARLARLGASGFAIALVVLFLFLRGWRAVAVVAVAVPVSLLAALAMLYLVGQSLNLITIFGLALAVGLLVDNSVVVYEAVQRRLERGAGADAAVRDGLRRTVRAIVAASATTAVVFLPLGLVDFDDVLVRELIEVVALSILLPLAASLVVALGLVPLLAHRLAAPAALRRLAVARRRRAARGGLVAPDRARLLFGGVVAGALRRPPAWIAGTAAAVLATLVIAVPWVSVQTATQEAPEADSVQLATRFSGGQGSIEAASQAMGRLERAVLDLEGVDTVEAMVREDGGSLTVQLADPADRPARFGAGARAGRGAGGGARGAGARDTAAGRGRDGRRRRRGRRGAGGARRAARRLAGRGRAVGAGQRAAREAGRERPHAAGVDAPGRSGVDVGPARVDEIWVEPNRRAFEAFGLTLDGRAAVPAAGGARGRGDGDRLRAADGPRAAPRRGAQGRPAPAGRQRRPGPHAGPDRDGGWCR